MSSVGDTRVAASDSAQRPRVNALAFPPPTTVRFVNVVAAMLAAGLFVGDWFHGFLRGNQWVQTLETCMREHGYLLDVDSAADQISRQQEFFGCTAGSQHLRAVYATGGAAAVILVGLGVLLAAPFVVERRRGLRPLGDKLAFMSDAVATLSSRSGLRRRPGVMLGRVDQRDAFTYGFPGRHRIALGPAMVKLAVRDKSAFEALALHELAHIRNRDVGLSWLTRGVRYAVLPLLALPLVVGIWRWQVGLIPDYLWRATILVILVWLVSLALLRSREHDADLRATRVMGQTAPMATLIGRIMATPPAGWRRLFAKHPAPADRADVVVRPTRIARARFGDGFVPAILAGSAVPLLDELVTTVATGTGLAGHQDLVAPIVGGLLLGFTVGITVFRDVAVQRAAGSDRPTPWWPATGVAVGLVLGQLASLANTTTGFRGGLDEPVWLVIAALAGLSATALVYSTAEIWTDAMPRFRSPIWAWLPGAVVASLTYAAALSFSHALQMLVDKGTWPMAQRYIANAIDSWPVVVAMLAVAAMAGAALAVKRPGLAPDWAHDHTGIPLPAWPVSGRRLSAVVVTGMLTGLCASVPATVHRYSVWSDLDHSDAVLRYLETTTWCGAIGGAAVALAMVLTSSHHGLALGVLAAVMAVATFVIGFAALNLRDGGANDIDFLAGRFTDALGVSLLVILAIAPLALIPWLPALRIVFTAALAGALAAAASAAAVSVVGSGPPITTNDVVMPEQMPAMRDRAAAQEYLDGMGEQLIAGLSDAYRTIGALQPADVAADPAAAGLTIRQQILVPLIELRRTAGAYTPVSESVTATHDAALAVLDADIAGYDRFALALQSGDLAAIASSFAGLTETTESFDVWQERLAALRSVAGRR